MFIVRLQDEREYVIARAQERVEVLLVSAFGRYALEGITNPIDLQQGSVVRLGGNPNQAVSLRGSIAGGESVFVYRYL